MKKLELNGGVTFQWPLLENLSLFYKRHFCTLVLAIAFFHMCSQRLGVVCVVFYSVLCCLDFVVWVWIIQLNFFPFSLFIYYSSPFTFFHFHFFLYFFSFAFYFVVSLSFCCASCYFDLLLHCLILLPRRVTHYVVMLLLHCFVVLLRRATLLFHRTALHVAFCASQCCLFALPRCLITLAFHLVVLPHRLVT